MSMGFNELCYSILASAHCSSSPEIPIPAYSSSLDLRFTSPHTTPRLALALCFVQSSIQMQKGKQIERKGEREREKKRRRRQHANLSKSGK